MGEREIWIEGIWWRWNEEREELVDGRGRSWGVEKELEDKKRGKR